jgi:DNA repair protein RecN (Recombination protein N)
LLARGVPVHSAERVITYLKVRNLAIVEELAIEPGAGLNVLTGETGAGKSLLIDSLEFLRGARGSTEMIRAGSDRMTAEAVFQLPASVGGELDELGIECESDDGNLELIVRREIAAGGRARVLVNGSPLSVRELGGAMDAVLEIHGQHESHQRVAGQNYRELVDDYGDHRALLEATRDAYADWKRAADQLHEMTDAQRDRTLRLDLLKYQVDEISTAKLDPSEEETLRSEKAILSHAREMIAATSGAFQLVDEDESSAIAQIGRALHLLQPLTKQIEEVSQVAGEMQDVLYRLQDLGRTLGNLAEKTRLDPARLEQIEDRLVTIERLNKKYGGTIEAVLDHLGRAQDEYERLADYEANVEKLQQAEATRMAAYRKAAEKLSAARKKAARAFEQAIQKELNDLAMERTTVKVDVAARDASPAADGWIASTSSSRRTAARSRSRCSASPRAASSRASSSPSRRRSSATRRAPPRPRSSSTRSTPASAAVWPRPSAANCSSSRRATRSSASRTCRRSPASGRRTSTSGRKMRPATLARASAASMIAEERVAEIARMLGGEKVSASAVRTRESCWQPPFAARAEMTRRSIRRRADDQRQLSEIARTLAEGKRRADADRHDLRPARRRGDDTAVARIAELKGREETKPFIVIAASATSYRNSGSSAGRPEDLSALDGPLR